MFDRFFRLKPLNLLTSTWCTRTTQTPETTFQSVAVGCQEVRHVHMERPAQMCGFRKDEHMTLRLHVQRWLTSLNFYWTD
jgi:hypothetical protein